MKQDKQAAVILADRKGPEEHSTALIIFEPGGLKMASGAGKIQTTCPQCGNEGRRPEGLCAPCLDNMNSQQSGRRYSAGDPWGSQTDEHWIQLDLFEID